MNAKLSALNGFEADSMADGRRLAFEESRKLGVTCKAETKLSLFLIL